MAEVGNQKVRLMKKYLRVKEADSLNKLDKIDRHEVKLLWANEWWDGPISGMLMYRGEKCWFQLFIDPDDPEVEKFPRQYLVIELSNDQLKEEEYWQTLFLEMVGSNNVWDEDGIRHTDRLKPLESRNEFFKLAKKRKPTDLSENRVVGFFAKDDNIAPLIDPPRSGG